MNIIIEYTIQVFAREHYQSSHNASIFNAQIIIIIISAILHFCQVTIQSFFHLPLLTYRACSHVTSYGKFTWIHEYLDSLIDKYIPYGLHRTSNFKPDSWEKKANICAS